MANEKRKLAPTSNTSNRGSSDELSLNVPNPLDRVPQFRKLAEAAKEQAPKLTRYQQESLDEFARQLAAGVTEDNKASMSRAPPKLARLSASRTLPKGEQ